MGGCLALLCATTGVGLYRIIHQVQTLVERQVQIDQTSGRAALEIRAAARSMEASLKRVRAYRVAANAACVTIVLCPEADQALTLALTAEYGIEKSIEVYWNSQKAAWVLGWGDRSPYPDFSFPLVDPTRGRNGFEAERYFLSVPPNFSLRVQDQNLASGAYIYRNRKQNWRVKWVE